MTPIEEDFPPEESEEEVVDAGVTQGVGRSAGNPYKPKKPKFGISQTGTDSWSAWTRGKPKSSWLELEKQPKSFRPNQYRPTSITAQAKSQAYRRQGLKTEFTHERTCNPLKMTCSNTWRTSEWTLSVIFQIRQTPQITYL